MTRTAPSRRSSAPARVALGHVLLFASLAIAVAGCAGPSAGSGGGSGRRGTPMRLGDALSAAIERHGSGLPYSVEQGTLSGRASIAVGVFSGSTPLGVVYAAETGAFLDERAEPPVDDEEAASLADLRQRLASGEVTLRSTLRMLESRYVMAEVTSVALLVRSDRLLVRVVTGAGAGAVEHLHDAATGERAALPDAGLDAGPIDAGPPDAGPVDGGPDGGPRDAGRRR